MASSDEEGEILPDCVINYHFVHNNNVPVSFCVLPLQWTEDEIPDNSNTQIYLSGTAETGQPIYKNVIAWKPELSYALPQIYVLCKDKKLIELKKPRKSFEDIVKSILVTVHCIHFLKRNPKADGPALWIHLHKAFRSYEVEPSKSHLLCHLPLIKEAVMRDPDFAKSEFIATLLLETSSKTGSYHEELHTPNKAKFIVDSQDDGEDDEDDDDTGDVIFDSVCALCDNGGELLCCEGKCLRSFHPNTDAGAESFCESLGYSDAQVEAIQTFFCNNCQYQQHQCFVCGKLGSSDQSSDPEVFQCANATCGYFYHPKCVAELLHPYDELKTRELQLKIHSGESFACPAHKCTLCKKGEDKAVYELQFGMCRRCPKAYHRKCLPTKITFASDVNDHQRAWDGLLSDRILIYCMDHEIISQIGTPKRNHILFPNVGGKKQTTSGLLSSKEDMIISRAFGNFARTLVIKQRTDHAGIHRTSAGTSVNHSLRHNDTLIGEKACRYSNMDKRKVSFGNSLPQLSTKYLPDSSKQKFPGHKNNQIADKCMKIKGRNSLPPVDAEMKSRILKLIKDSTSSLKMEDIDKCQKTSSSARIAEDKTFTEGKVQGYVNAVRTALNILDGGGCLEDAKAVCEPQVLKQLFKWKRALDVYLAPVLHGKRYTSFGRHFTKVNKLEEIVDRLKWYVQDGDMIVDFCCGSNDFSCLASERLDKMGKKCSFKNYDLFTPKNDFNFEKRDWMSVNLEELPEGSNLIMGLNPPFGVNASLANKFINQAIKFKPKLLILIVPKETERLDRKRFPYDIVWEDDQLLTGMSFYLPGSVDVKDKQLEQWNNVAPPLYLWSRPDWTAKHKAIAQERGHLIPEPKIFEDRNVCENQDGMYANVDMDIDMDTPIYSPANVYPTGGSFHGMQPGHYAMDIQHQSVFDQGDVYPQQMNHGAFSLPYDCPPESRAFSIPYQSITDPAYYLGEPFYPGGQGF